MNFNINCTSLYDQNKCSHQAAPRSFFGATKCILWMQATYSSADPRQPEGCRLCVNHPRPAPPPRSPSRVLTKGSKDLT